MRRAWPLVAALLAAGCASGAARPPQAPDRGAVAKKVRTAPPNIVLILTDDLDMSHVQYMPRLRRQLAEKGLTFRNSFVTYAVCAPSRASILTGQYAHNHGVVENRPPRGSFRKFYNEGREASTIATWLRAAGYRTGLVGKYMNYYPPQRNPSYVPVGWDDWRGYFDWLSMAGNRAYYEYDLNENGRVVRYGTEEKDYLTDVMSGQALDFIKGCADDQPFFLYLSTFAPHAPVVPADRHGELFPDIKAPRSPNYDEEDVSDKPAWIRELPRMAPEVQAATDAWYRKRIQAMQAVDEMVERVVQALEARGLLDDSFVFFASDNGFQFGAHRLDHGKGDAYDESIRVPLIVRGPGVARGRSEDALALNIDLAPTFAAIAGAEAPETVDGRSLLRVLTGKATLREAREDFLVEFQSREEAGITEYTALRTREQLYVEYATGERELYDLKTDPYEMESLHRSADPGVLQRLSDRLVALKACSGQSCRS